MAKYMGKSSDEIWKLVMGNKQQSGQQGQTAAQTGAKTGASGGRYSGMSADDIWKSVMEGGGQETSQTGLGTASSDTGYQKWLRDYDTVSNKYYSWAKKNSGEGKWQADSFGGTKEAMESLLDRYDDISQGLDEKDKTQFQKAYDGLKQTYDALSESGKYYAQFRDQDDYDRARSGYTNFGVGYAAESYGLDDGQARALRQEQVQKDARERQRALAEYVAAKKEFTPVDQEYRLHSMDDRDGVPYTAEYEEDLNSRYNQARAKVTAAENALLSARNRMDAYNATWGKIDRYAKYADAAKNEDTSYTGASFDEIRDYEYKLENEPIHSDREALAPAEVQDKYLSGWLAQNPEPNMDDSLGLWLSMTEEQREHAKLSSFPTLQTLWNTANDGLWDALNDTEIQTYYYLRHNQGQEAALQYLKDLNPELNRRTDEAFIETVQNASTAGRWGYEAAAYGLNLIGNVEAGVGELGEMITGNHNPYSNTSRAQRYAGYIRGINGQSFSKFAEDVAKNAGASEEFAAGAAKYAENTYQAITSGFDSAIGATVFGPAYLSIMGLGAMAQKSSDLELRGASNRQIAVGAVGAGCIEMLFEKVSLDHFFENFIKTPPKSWKELIAKTLVQAGIEGNEEINTEIANIAFDAINMGKNCDVSMSIRQYMAQGLSEEEAKKRATVDAVTDIYWAGFGGFVSGGAMAGASGTAKMGLSKAANAMGNYDVGKPLLENGRVADLQAQAEALTDAKKSAKLSKAAQEVAYNASVGDNSLLNTYKTGKVATQIAKQAGREASKASVTEFRNAAEKYLAGQRDIKNKKHALNVLTRAFEGTTTVPGDKAAMRRWGNQMTQEILEGIGGKETLQENAKARAASAIQTAVDVQSSVLGFEPTKGETAFEYNQEGDTQAYLKDSADPVNIRAEDPVAKIENGKMWLNTDDGQVVEADNVSFGTADDASLASIVSRMNITADQANSLYAARTESGMSAKSYATALQNAYLKGFSGVTYNGIQDYSAAAKLPGDVRRTAWEAGRQMRNRQTTEQAAKISKGTQMVNQRGLTFRDSAKSIKNLNEQQKTGIAAAKALAAAGLHIEVYASTEAERANGAPNGIYRSSDGTIHIDLNAGDNGQGTVAYAVAHEATHFIKDWSATKYQTYADILIEAAESKGISYDSLLDRQLAKLSALEENRGKTAEELQQLAYDETIAEMSETMLTDTDAAKRVSQELYKKDRTLWEKIRDFFTGLVEKLRSAYKGLDPDSDMGRITRQAIRDNEKVAQAWAEAVVEAGENYSAGQTGVYEDLGIQTEETSGAAQNVKGEELLQNTQQVEEAETAETETRSAETKTVSEGELSNTDKRRERLKDYLNEAWSKGDGSAELRDALQRMWSDEYNLNFRTDDEYRKYMEDTLPDLEAGDIKTIAQVRQDFAAPTAKFVHENRVNAERDAVRNLNMRNRAYENARNIYGENSAEANTAKYFVTDAEQKLQKVRGLNEGMYAALEGRNSEHERVTRRYLDLAYKEFYGREAALDGQKNNARGGEKYSPRMTSDMTEQERYDKLKDLSLTVTASVNQDAISEAEAKYGTDIRDGVRLKSNDRKKLFQKIASIFGVTRDYRNQDIELEFGFSNENLSESLNKQKRYYYSYLKMLSCFENVVDSAIGIETHNRNEAGYKVDPTLKNMYVLVSAFQDGENITPVKLEIKEFSDKPNTLYVAIALDSIQGDKIGNKKSGIATEGNTVSGVTQSAPPLTVSLADLFANVNPQDSSFLKYVPTQFLTEQQRAGEKYSSRNARDAEYMELAKDPEGNREVLQQMVKQAAKDAGYTQLFYHGSKKGGGFTVFRDWQYFTENRDYAKRYTDRNNEKSLYTTYVKMENPFDTRIDSVRDIFEDARMEYGMGELLENGLPDWTDGYDIADYIDENDLPYDSIVLDEGGDMVNGKPVRRGLSYVVRKSNQVKSADTVTYDDSGNVIPLSQRFDTANEDIRYSSRNNQESQVDRLARKNEELKAAVEALKYQQEVIQKAQKGLWEAERADIKRSYEKQMKELREQNTQKAHEKVESRHRTEERHKLQNTVDTLNRLLLKPTNTAHVPQELQSSVAMAMKVINEVMLDSKAGQNADRLSEYAYRLRELEKNPSANAERIADLNRKIRNLTGKDISMKAALTSLQEQYAKLEGQDGGLYDENIAALIADAKETIGNTAYKDLSLDQLKAVRDTYTALLTTIRNANKAFVAGQNARIDDMVKRATMELSLKNRKKPTQTAVRSLKDKFSWNNEKPVYAFERIGSAVMSELYNNLRKGEDTFARDISEARDFFLGATEKYGYSKWNMEDLQEFEASDGRKFQLSLDERMSLYAYSLRPQAREHLNRGGIVLSENTRRAEQVLLGVTKEVIYNDANAYTLTNETIDAIVNSLTKEQKQFAYEMQQYLAKVMGAKGDEVNMAKYGIKKFTEETYWPLKSSSVFSERVLEQQRAVNKWENSGFTQALTQHANNAIELSPLVETWAQHVNDMSTFHALVLPMADFTRVYNWNQKGDTDGKRTMGVRQMIQQTSGKAAVDYIDQFLQDLNGGLRADPRETVERALLSSFKKAAVSASLSVAIQQPSAIGRAFAFIEANYFVGAKVEDAGGIKEAYDQMKKYSGIAVIKEMGRYDVGMGQSTIEYIVGRNSLGTWGKITGTIDELAGKLPELGDQITWVAIWEAAKRKTAAQNPGLRGEALLKKSAELFEYTLERSQVYDSVFSRSANMRAKTGLMSMVTAFMAEPTTTANMVSDAIRKFKSGDKRMAGKMLSSVAVATVLNAALAAVVYAARDDDKTKTYWEKYMASLASETIDSFNPLTYVPVVADINNLLLGYSIERTDMKLASDFVTDLKRLATLYGKFDPEWDEEEQKEWEKKIQRAWFDNALMAGTILGLPLKNVARDVEAVINTYTNPSKKAPMSADTVAKAVKESLKKSIPIYSWKADESNSDQLYDAITQGKDVLAKRLKAQYGDEKKYESALLKGLKENDPRIKEAAQYALDLNTPKRVAIIREIVAEGHFTQDQVIKAINQKALSMKEKTQSDKESPPEKLYGYDEFVHAAANGLGYAKTVQEEMTSYQADRNQEKDKKLTREEAEETAANTIKSGIKGEAKDGYEAGELTEEQVRKVLIEADIAKGEELDDLILQWDTELELGREIDWGDTRYLEYAREIRPAGISVDVYDEWLRQVNYHLKGVDEDGDGKADRNSAVKQKAAYINSLPLTAEQKEALWRTVSTSARTLRKYRLW